MTKTVFVTGASGFIGKHVVLKLLQEGYVVRGSVRSTAKADEVRRAMEAHLEDTSGLADRLSFVELDLTRDAGWDTALAGTDALLHTASPFPLAEPTDENDLIRPAVDGTLRALRAAKSAGVKRVVLTSSVAAVYASRENPDDKLYTEADWTDIDSPMAGAYVKSKTMAERAAWDFVSDNSAINLTTINPILVLGPALDTHVGSSLEVIQRVMNGKDPAVPNLNLGVVDVRDIAAMHVAALSKPDSIDKRFIGASRDIWFIEMARLLKSTYPDRKIATLKAPNWMIRGMAKFDPQLKSVLPLLGKRYRLDNSQARTILGIDFIPAEESIKASAAFLVENNLVN